MFRLWILYFILRLFFRTDLKERLSETDWCNYLAKLLVESNEHDTREKVLKSIQTLVDVCKKKINNLKVFLKILTDLTNSYKNLSINSEDDEYFRQISDLAFTIKEYLNNFRQKELRNDL